jgi:hypothetical protein
MKKTSKVEPCGEDFGAVLDTAIDPETDKMQLTWSRRGDLSHAFQINVTHELERARRIHPHKIASVHEGYALLCEELNKEFFDEVCKKEKHHDPIAMYKELVQIAVVAQRIAEDVLQV